MLPVVAARGSLEASPRAAAPLVPRRPFGRRCRHERRDERTYGDLTTQIAALLMRRMGYGAVAQAVAAIRRPRAAGRAGLAFARDERLHQASATAAGLSPACEQDLQRGVRGRAPAASARGRRSRLDDIAASSRALIAWVCAAAAATGLLIGPLGLLLLRRVLARLQGVGAALIRLARNDTSVDIPGPRPSGRGGPARALGGGLQGQVDRAPAKEGRARAAQSPARCGHQQHAAGA